MLTAGRPFLPTVVSFPSTRCRMTLAPWAALSGHGALAVLERAAFSISLAPVFATGLQPSVTPSFAPLAFAVSTGPSTAHSSSPRPTCVFFGVRLSGASCAPMALQCASCLLLHSATRSLILTRLQVFTSAFHLPTHLPCGSGTATLTSPLAALLSLMRPNSSSPLLGTARLSRCGHRPTLTAHLPHPPVPACPHEPLSPSHRFRTCCLLAPSYPYATGTPAMLGSGTMLQWTTIPTVTSRLGSLALGVITTTFGGMTAIRAGVRVSGLTCARLCTFGSTCPLRAMLTLLRGGWTPPPPPPTALPLTLRRGGKTLLVWRLRHRLHLMP